MGLHSKHLRPLTCGDIRMIGNLVKLNITESEAGE